MVPEKEVGSTSDAHSLDESDHEEPEPEKIPERKSRFDRNTSSRSLQQLQSRAHSRGSFAIDVEPQRPEPVPEVLPEPEKVPRAQRRGWFGRYTLIAEVTEPKHYPRRIKWFITFIIAVAAMAAPIGSTIIFRENTFQNASTHR